jgi:glycosyltransferase involved in cell wall biosynthesis
LPDDTIDNRPRITVVLPTLSIGGLASISLILTEGLVKQGHDVELVGLRETPLQETEVPASICVTRLKAKRVLRAVPALVRHIKSRRPQVLLAMGTGANVVAVLAAKLARKHTRVVVSEHCTLSYKARAPYLRSGKLLVRGARWTYPRADSIVAVSRGVADDLAKLLSLNRARIQVIYNPTYSPKLNLKANLPLADEWFTPQAKPVILSVGRLVTQKGFETLIRAFAKVRARRDVRLLILGDGPERQKLENLIDQLKLSADVRLPGHESNPLRYMARARMFVLSSLWEGLPGVLIEAMACGCPVVSTDCPSGPREILLCDEIGSMVPVDDVEAMANAIERQLDSVPQVDRLRQRAAEFSLNKAIAAYLKVLLPDSV